MEPDNARAKEYLRSARDDYGPLRQRRQPLPQTDLPPPEARTAWDDNKNENDATLYAADNAALTAAGYPDSAGGEIT